jgi:hypothetical protein
MGLTAVQLDSLLKNQQENISTNREVSDHVTSSEEVQTATFNESWLDALGNLSDDLKSNTAVMLNLGTASGLNGSKNKRFINNEGFPPHTNVFYTLAAPGSFIPWSKDTDREVKQIVLHSFGHQWHAFKSSGRWLGVMNELGQSTPVEYEQDSKVKLIWVPKGTDMNHGQAHSARLATALRSIVRGDQGTTGMHFLIDRLGALYVLADANNIFNCSGELSETSIAIGLEEALYLETDSGGARPQYATWLPGGDPPGTEGNLSYWDFSQEQYLTLAALIYKLRTVYPSLNTTSHSVAKNITSSFSGFTMHGHIQKVESTYVDVSPHFQDEDIWNKFFTLVDGQTQAGKVAVWKPQTDGYLGRQSWIEDVVTKFLNTTELSNQLSTNPALPILAGIYRSHLEAAKTSKDYRTKAAELSFRESNLQSSRKGMGKSLEIAATAGIVVPSRNQKYVGQEYSTVEKKEGAIDLDELY